ncbi:MAG: hypothetical protein PF693_10995 [Spirochaetia bacterium]|jgi:hypothetical protein|nr:hypothetical protein [Spirochaetia bacterium]
MSVQTTKGGYISFPDGGKVSIKEAGGSYLDIGAINSAVNFTLNYTENQIDTANYGKTDLQARDMSIDGSLTLINVEPEVIEKFGGGLLTIVDTAGSTVIDADITDQSIATFVDGTPEALSAIVTATGVGMKFSTTPVLVTVTASSSGVLAAGVDYQIVTSGTSASGYAILFNPLGTATVGITETITVDFDDNVPVASSTIYGGSSTKVLSAYALKIEHTNSSSVIDKSFEIYSGNSTSGGFQFNFKGANEDGLNEMPLTFKGDLDTSLTDGRQLFAYYTKSTA